MNIATTDLRLAEVLASTGGVLLDFDGPLTPLMPAPMNRHIADALRGELSRRTIEMPDSIANSNDPLAVLRFAATRHDAALITAAENVCRDGEIEAAAVATPTPGGHELLSACERVGRKVVIVSNNAPEAIESYLDRFELRALVLAVLGRPHGRPDLMKPHPGLLRRAIDIIGELPHHIAFIGDSVSDVDASKAAAVRSIGYAKTPSRGSDLDAAGADAIISDMRALASAISRSP